jgi:plastocyanin
LLAVTAGISACGDSSGSSESDTAPAKVTIDTFTFAPDPLQVDAGTTIHFENHDSINHSVTAGTRSKPTPDVFDHVLDGKGTTYELTLRRPGTYRYFCKFHPGQGMTAVIVVR